MPKKPPKNAFFFFMLHFQEQERKRGRHYHGLPEVSAAASEPWKEMNAQQRGPFEKKAKEAKHGPKQVVEKYTSQGIPLSMIDKEQKELENEHRTMLRTIKEMVYAGFTDNNIASKELIFISGNFFIQVKGNYFPAEIAMVKMTFENGIVKKFHTYVNPDRLPLGYQFETKENSEKTHRLPIPPNAKGEKNFQIILDEMKKFMGDSRQILFTVQDNIPMIKSFIQSFIDYDGESDEDAGRYRVYPLHQLFYEIKEEAVKNSLDGVSFKSIFIAEEHLKREDYAYLAGTACAYHEELDCAKYCALAHVQNWAYIFNDHICVDLNIMPENGKHFPPGIDVSHVVADMTRSNATVSEFNDTGSVSFIDEPEPPRQQSRSAAVATSHWGGARPTNSVPANKDDDFPSLGSHSRRAAAPRNRSDQRDVNNPWNTSSSSSSSSSSSGNSNPWNQRQNDSAHASSFRGSEMDTSYSRGMGRGSLLFRNESGFGRGRSHNERTTERTESGSSHRHDRSKRQHSSDDRSDKRRR